jgi:hypothetical protein
VLRLALVLLVVGYGPLLATQYVFTGFEQLIPVLLAFTVGPLGAAALLVAVILFLVALVRRPPGPS